MALPEALRPLFDAPARSAVLTDFDGTLADIVLDPAAAAPLDGAPEVLRGLTARFAAVVVVSGRPASYLVATLGTGIALSGLYGLQDVGPDGRVVMAEAALPWARVATDVATRARQALGPVVEEKGVSLTLHYRDHPEREREITSWATDEGTRGGLVVRVAKASVELHPPVAADKGSVVDRIVDGLDAACFLGDDVGDLPAFDALDRFAARGGHAVRVGVRSSETPEELLASADLVVEGPAGALAVLQALAGEDGPQGS